MCRIQFYFTNKSQTFAPVSYVTFNGLSAKRHQIRIRYRKKTRTMNINGPIDIVSTEAVIDLQASKQPCCEVRQRIFPFGEFYGICVVWHVSPPLLRSFIYGELRSICGQMACLSTHSTTTLMFFHSQSHQIEWPENARFMQMEL